MIIHSSLGLYLSRKDKLEESILRNDESFKIIFNHQQNNLYQIRSNDISFGGDSFLFIPPGTNHQQLKIQQEKVLLEIHPSLINELCDSFNQTPLSLFQMIMKDKEQINQLSQLHRTLRMNISETIKTNYIDYFITQFIVNHFTAQSPDFAEFIDLHYMESWSLDSLAERMGYSKYHLIRKFNQQFNMTPIEYLNYRRVQAACHLLLNSDATITHIAFEVGFQSTGQLNAWFRKFLMMTPKEFKAHYRNRHHH